MVRLYLCIFSNAVVGDITLVMLRGAAAAEADEDLLAGKDPHNRSSGHSVCRHGIFGSIPFHDQLLIYWTMSMLQPDPMHTLGSGVMETIWRLMTGMSLSANLATYEVDQNKR